MYDLRSLVSCAKTLGYYDAMNLVLNNYIDMHIIHVLDL
jgi:hypothetical protein